MKNLAPAFANEFAAPALRRSRIAKWSAQIAVTGFVAGHFCLPNVWLHLGWLLLAGIPALVFGHWLPWLRQWRTDGGVWTVAIFLGWMTIRSCAQAPLLPGHALDDIMRGCLGTALLVMFCAFLWRQAQDGAFLRYLGWTTGVTAAFAAFLSIGLSYFLLPGHQAGERLMNLLVHGGLNPVCTGLTFGFAGLWLVSLVESEVHAAARRLLWPAGVLLHLAAFLSGSRGVMLALACGHAVLLAARGWGRGAGAFCIFLLTGLFYFTSAPLFARLAHWRSHSPATTTAPGITHHFHQAVERGDNSRLDIYRAGLQAVDNPWLGTGQWGVRELWQAGLPRHKTNLSLMSHLHSACFASFVHGGIIGAVLLAMTLVCGFRRAGRLATQGDATWVSLLAFGCGGLLFDGESLTSLATVPRFEGLLFWLPLIVALARGSATAPPGDS